MIGFDIFFHSHVKIILINEINSNVNEVSSKTTSLSAGEEDT